ncbi:MAG: hypothetical protein ABEJ92_08490 [Halobacteriales archaeon]
MRAVAEGPASLREELADTHNVLLLAPAFGSADAEVCSRLLSFVTPDRADLLCVTFNQTPDARLEAWRNAGGPTDPANLGFVVVGERVRSATMAARAADSPDGLGPAVASVSSPGDMTGIGIEYGNFVDDWDDARHRLLVCFHTLTTFLQYAELRDVYRFIHALTGRVRAAGGMAHYHLDPEAHDERTVNTLLGLFDAAVEPDGAGTWLVRRRR